MSKYPFEISLLGVQNLIICWQFLLGFFQKKVKELYSEGEYKEKSLFYFSQKFGFYTAYFINSARYTR